eukprot:1389702-Amphidinium_carterae.1
MLSGMGSINISRGSRTFHSPTTHRSPSPMTVRLTHLSRHLRTRAELLNMPRMCYLDDVN